MRSRSFFYVCAALLCLGLGYQLGARRASAQSGLVIEGPELAQHGGAIDASGCVSRILYVSGAPVGPAIPGASAIAATAVLGNSSTPYGALLANGDVYLFQNPGGWVLRGNMLGASPTQAARQTFEQVKVRYR